MRHSLMIVPLVAVLVSAFPLTGQAGLDVGFLPDEVLVSDPNAGLRGIVDPEYDSIQSLFCWIDRRGSLWVGSMDPATGLLLPPDGRGQLVDTGAATVGQIGNGPEWVYTDVGPQIAYTTMATGAPALKRAYYDGTKWVAAPLATAGGRLGPLASTDLGDPTPTISYLGPKIGANKPVYVRHLTDAASEQMIPTTASIPRQGHARSPGPMP